MNIGDIIIFCLIFLFLWKTKLIYKILDFLTHTESEVKNDKLNKIEQRKFKYNNKRYDKLNNEIN